MIYNSIWVAWSIRFAPNLAVQSLELDKMLRANLITILTSSVMAVISTYLSDLCAVGKMNGKFKMAFFRYHFMNLISIFSKRRGGG